MSHEGGVVRDGSPTVGAPKFAPRAARSAKREQLRALAPPQKERRGRRGGGGGGMRTAKRETRITSRPRGSPWLSGPSGRSDNARPLPDERARALRSSTPRWVALTWPETAARARQLALATDCDPRCATRCYLRAPRCATRGYLRASEGDLARDRAPRCATRGYLRALAPPPSGRAPLQTRPRRAMRCYIRATGGDLANGGLGDDAARGVPKWARGPMGAHVRPPPDPP